MIQAGLEGEVRGLLGAGYGAELSSMMSIGYRHMVNFIKGIWDMQKMKEVLARDTRRYAKRQFTWFYKTDNIVWFDAAEPVKIMKYVTAWFEKFS